MLTVIAGFAMTLLLSTAPTPAQGGTDGCKVLDDIGSCSLFGVSLATDVGAEWW